MSTVPDADRPEFLKLLRETLPTWANKYVKVVMRKPKASHEDKDLTGYFLVEYFGDLQDPPLRPYPEDDPNGPTCLYLQDRSVQRNMFALNLDSVEEVDDEVQQPQPMTVNMSGLSTSG